MNKLFPLILIFVITVGCNQKVEDPPSSKSEVIQKYPSTHFWEVDILEERLYEGSYDAEADVIHSVDEDTEVISPVSYVLNLSEEVVLITDRAGKILEEFKVLERIHTDGFYTYNIEREGEKHKLTHTIEKDGRFTYFTLRNKDSLRVYLTKSYNN